MSITIKKIAELAGVHRSTVDKVLHQREGVSKPVREKIQAIIDEYEYKPNPIGKALKMQDRKLVISVILLKVDALDYLLEGIKAALNNYPGFDIETTYQVIDYPDVDCQYKTMKRALEQKVDGMILSPINSPKISEMIDLCEGENIPVVTINSDVKGSNRMCFIGQDGSRASRVAARLMGEMVQGKVAVYTSEGDEKRSFSFDAREEGFRDKINREFPDIQLLPSIRTNEDPKLVESETHRLLKEHGDLRGIYITGGAVSSVGNILKELGRTDIKVICFEEYSEIFELMKDGIIDITIGSGLNDQGQQSIHVLMDYLVYGKKTEKKHLYTEIKVLVKEHID
ncbi:MAG TPA: LacI family DNA-binding transcriptional regulator [Candidatus Pelethocola excrementipullorum]|nr:LacI family DNA-binding transcriptional regulator [Candidatus Pelethocola excrementipullorum]